MAYEKITYALEDGVEYYLIGRPSQTVYRRYNIREERSDRPDGSSQDATHDRAAESSGRINA